MSDKEKKTGEAAQAVASDDKDIDAAVVEKQVVAQLHRQKHFRLVINSGRDAQDRCPVFLAVNGREYLICRDKEVVVPEAVVNVLNDAVEMKAVSSQGEDGQTVVSWKPAKRFSYSVLGESEAPKAEKTLPGGIKVE